MADGISQFLSPSDLHRLSLLTLNSRYVVEGNLAGRHRSPLRGSSSEFTDHRNYMPGDDPKHIDWKVLGRTDRYFVRRFEAETNLRVYLVVDRSGSMRYASGKTTKYDYACRLAAAVGYVTVKAKDSVGLYLYGDRIDAVMGPRNSFSHLNNLLKVLGRQEPGAMTRTAHTLHHIAETIRKRAMIVLLSDLFDEPADIVRALAHFRKQHHDVILFHVLDPAELDFPFKRSVEFEDLETGERLVVDPRTLAPAYRKVFAEFLEEYRRPCAEMRVDYRLVQTDHPPEPFVRAYLSERARLSR